MAVTNKALVRAASVLVTETAFANPFFSNMKNNGELALKFKRSRKPVYDDTEDALCAENFS